MKIVVSAPSSHPAVRWVTHGLAGRGHEIAFFTSFAVPSDAELDRIFFWPALKREFERRRLPKNLVQHTVHNAAIAHDLLRVLFERMDRLKLNLRVHNKMIVKVQNAAIRQIKETRPDFVIATGSMNAVLAEYCFANNIPLVIYLPQPVMGLVRKLDSSQAEKMLPEETIKASELFAATHFLASSTFVSESLRDSGLHQPIIRCPLGFPKIESGGRTRKWAGEAASGPFKMIFVGRASEQKGLTYLFTAVRELIEAGRRVELLAVSRDVDKLTRMVQDANLSQFIRVVPPMPRSELFAEFRDRDLFILPSIFEGYGLVLVEALANALPVISTPLTAAADLNVHNNAGFVVPAKSSSEIVKGVVRVMDDPDLHSAFSDFAEESTRHLDWESYALTSSLRLEESITNYLARA